MDGRTTQGQQMRQVGRAIPEQIIAGEILQLPRVDLERRLEADFQSNPALVLEEAGLCPMCDSPVSRYPCPTCGYMPEGADDVPVVCAEDWETYRQTVHDDEAPEPYATVAAGTTLREYLHGQWAVVADGAARSVGAYLIDCLDEDGYITEPLIDIAQRLRLSVPQLETVLFAVQELEPAGVAARDLKECLAIQCARHDDTGPVRTLAAAIIADAWEGLASRRIPLIAERLGVAQDAVETAVKWIRDRLAPYPGRTMRTGWDHLTPRFEPQSAPDVVIRNGPDGFIIEIVESSRFRVGIDSYYRQFSEAVARSNGPAPPEFEHIRRSVATARFLIDAIAQRRRTLYLVMTAVASAQREFLLKGKAHLKPLMQKEIAARIGIHESTVCRALADKLVSIPSGETILASQFFDDAAPVKEALVQLVGREDPAKPLSDSRLAQLLSAAGHQVARRTVAKYRDSLRIPPMEIRSRS